MTTSLSPDTLLDAAVSARQEAAGLRFDAKAAWKRAVKDAEEIAHYRDVLATIEEASGRDSVLQDETLVLCCINDLAHRALNYTGPRHRTWRDRWQAWWMTRRVRKT